MKLVKWGGNPWRAVEELQSEINRLFDFSYGKGLAPAATLTVPSVDISEDENSVFVEADVPGFEQKDINISLRKNILSISGKKEESKEEKKKNYHRVERVSQNFCREIELPKAVDGGKVKAAYKSGVLRVELPKKEEEKEKEIKINVE